MTDIAVNDHIVIRHTQWGYRLYWTQLDWRGQEEGISFAGAFEAEQDAREFAQKLIDWSSGGNLCLYETGTGSTTILREGRKLTREERRDLEMDAVFDHGVYCQVALDLGGKLVETRPGNYGGEKRTVVIPEKAIHQFIFQTPSATLRDETCWECGSDRLIGGVCQHCGINQGDKWI